MSKELYEEKKEANLDEFNLNLSKFIIQNLDEFR